MGKEELASSMLMTNLQKYLYYIKHPMPSGEAVASKPNEKPPPSDEIVVSNVVASTVIVVGSTVVVVSTAFFFFRSRFPFFRLGRPDSPFPPDRAIS